MLNSSEAEFKMMYEAEEKLWWYRVLHEKVLAEIQQKFREKKDISILDVGCGTGGLLHFLRQNNYTNLQGIDYSDASIHFSKIRNLNVQKANIDDISKLFFEQQFDVIICNDVFYCLYKSQIVNALSNISALLKTDGIFLSNNNAFNIFYGTHDIAVGGKWRFTIKDFQGFLQNTPLQIQHYSYWTWVLSPLVLSIRIFQQIQLKLSLIDTTKLVSDVSVPPVWLNGLFYKIVKFEEKILKKGFFGSSLFYVARQSLPCITPKTRQRLPWYVYLKKYFSKIESFFNEYSKIASSSS